MRKHIILADEHPVISLGVSSALAATPGKPFMVAGTAHSEAALLELLHRKACDLLITDFTLPHTRFPQSLAMIGEIRRDFRDMPVMVMTMGLSVGTARALLALGVVGLYDKRSGTSELVDGVQLVLRRKRFLCSNFTALLLKHSPRVLPSRLSAPEEELVAQLGHGLQTRQIAARKGRTEKTLRQHLTLIKDKLGLPDDDALQYYATGIKDFRAMALEDENPRKLQLRRRV